MEPTTRTPEVIDLRKDSIFFSPCPEDLPEEEDDDDDVERCDWVHNGLMLCSKES